MYGLTKALNVEAPANSSSSAVIKAIGYFNFASTLLPENASLLFEQL